MATRVLIVDDNEGNRLIAAAMLAGYGCEVVPVDSGFKALELLYAQEHTFDAVFMDYAMPTLDGIEVVAEIRNHPDLAKLPVAMISGYVMKNDIERFIGAGVDVFLAKPYRKMELYQTLEIALAKGRDRRS